ncbi:hypothetical protein [Mucilaginibacter sp. OK098]|uniref:hypothetical protein n=1 Tax=Mucilaginibacter sp. OK098 TaxID=1855297 RepID=UPI000916BA2C|nr:hypothetical protein [Mucilaginibacter sp. OK098]SHN17824.1 hypothetical protein SAMN05216524_106148 [Mucilaginibacter sp. OK098]
MIRKITNLIIFALALSTLYSCQKQADAIDHLKKSCLYDVKMDYFKKWSNTFTEIDTYNSTGAIASKSFIYPVGYFQLSANSTYNVLSNSVPLTGVWDITDSCKLLLDKGTPLERQFDVLKLSTDSLTLHRKDNNIVYTQHYVSFRCPETAKLLFRWDNTVIESEYFNSSGVYSTSVQYPDGFFTLNADNTYNRISNGVSLNGVWEINDACQLVLDKSTSNERSFEVQKVTADSLVIWRKDVPNGVNYLQRYKKH